MKNKKTLAFVDASNLFYGGEKSLGWSIDYKLFKKYFIEKYNAKDVFYFGGVDLHGFSYNFLDLNSVPLKNLNDFLYKKEKKLKNKEEIRKIIQRVKFYKKLVKFGFKLFLKPLKSYKKDGITLKSKANCDVDLTLHAMQQIKNFDRIILCSGDGDFLELIKFLRKTGKEVIILSRVERTAKEIKIFAGEKFRDFGKLKNKLQFTK